MNKDNVLFLVRFVDRSRNEEDYLVYRTTSLQSLFDEIIDLIGVDGVLIGIERIYVTDLDIKEIL